jgi:uncharacterized membrane protein (UPF0127 family)
VKAFNPRSGKYIATKVIEATTVFKRMKGLLGRDSLPAGEALWLRPCKSVHTIGMKFPIDILFLGKDRKVVGVEENIPPNRFSSFAFRADGALELPAGTVSESDTRVGDVVDIS